MGTTTFSGPIKAGTIRDTTGTTVGIDVANVGQVVMCQSFEKSTWAAGANNKTLTNIVIPAHSEIVNIIFQVLTITRVGAAATATQISLGTPTFPPVGAGKIGILDHQSTTTTSGLKTVTSAAGVENEFWWTDTGPDDLQLTMTSSSATVDSGRIRVKVLYMQSSKSI